MIMFTVNVKVAFMAQVNFDNSNNITVIMAIMAKITINMKNNDDVTIQGDIITSDVTRYDVITQNKCKCGDLTTTRTVEEEAAGLLLALPSTAEMTQEEEMPCVGSLLLDLPLLQLPQEQQPFSQGPVVVNTTGKGGEGGEEEKKEVPARGSLLLKSKNKRETWCTRRAHNKKIAKQRKEKTQKLNVFIGSFSWKEDDGGVIPTPHPHPTPPVAHGWDPPAWGGGR